MPLPKTTLETADAQGRARPSAAGLEAANEVALLLGNPILADSLVLDIADTIDIVYARNPTKAWQRGWST